MNNKYAKISHVISHVNVRIDSRNTTSFNLKSRCNKESAYIIFTYSFIYLFVFASSFCIIHLLTRSYLYQFQVPPYFLLSWNSRRILRHKYKIFKSRPVLLVHGTQKKGQIHLFRNTVSFLLMHSYTDKTKCNNTSSGNQRKYVW